MQKKVEGAGADLPALQLMCEKIRFFTINQTLPNMSAIIEARHNIMEMLFQLENVEALLKVEQQIKEVLRQTSSSEDYPLGAEKDAPAVSEPVAVYPDLSSPEYQVKDSVDLDVIMEPDGRTTEEIKQEWAALSDVFSYISEDETRAFLEID